MGSFPDFLQAHNILFLQEYGKSPLWLVAAIQEMGRDERGSASLAQTKQGDDGVPTGPRVQDGAGMRAHPEHRKVSPPI